MHLVVFKGDAVVDLDRMGIDLHLDAKRLQDGHELEVEVGHRARDQRHAPGASVTDVNRQAMVDEVEVHLEHALAEWNRRGAQPTRGDCKRDVPPLIEEWRKLELDLADDLRPHMECCAGWLPVGVRQGRPYGIVVCSLSRHQERSLFTRHFSLRSFGRRAYDRGPSCPNPCGWR